MFSVINMDNKIREYFEKVAGKLNDAGISGTFAIPRYEFDAVLGQKNFVAFVLVPEESKMAAYEILDSLDDNDHIFFECCTNYDFWNEPAHERDREGAVADDF